MLDNQLSNNRLPFLSIITITFNSELYITQAIDSILAQTFNDFELIILDDASEDSTWDKISQFQDPRIHAYRNDANIGEYRNRNKALEFINGKYVLFIDGDDILYPHALQTFKTFESIIPNEAQYFAQGTWDSRIICPLLLEPRQIYQFHYFDKSKIGGNFTKVFFKSDILKSFGLPTIIKTGDTFIQLKIAQKHSAVLIPGELSWWRKRKGNATSKIFETSRYLIEITNYYINLLNNDCPLTLNEIKLAKINIYGVFYRNVIRLIFKGDIAQSLYILKKVKVEKGFRSALFYRHKSHLFKYLSGDNPAYLKISQNDQ